MRVVMIWECSVINKIKKDTPAIISQLILTTFLLTGLRRASHSRNNFSSLFPLHFCLSDCCVLRTPAILSQSFPTTFFRLPDCWMCSHSRNPF